MRPLSATLLAAQRSGSAQPSVRVRLFDFDAGSARLRWTQWAAGAEPPGPSAAAVPADGALLRARIDAGAGTLHAQRVASPGEASDYGTWSDLGAVAATPGLGLAAAGDRALLVSVAADGVSVQAHESVDAGATYGAPSVLAVAGVSVDAVAAALQADGSALVAFAAAGIVYALTRAGLAAWSGPAAWSESLASVSGLAALHELDYAVLVTGVDAGGVAGAWATVLGTGVAAPPGAWLGLQPLALAAAGTSVAYSTPSLAIADAPRAAFVETHSGPVTAHRAHLASAVAGTSFGEFQWRETRPLDVASAHGVALAARAGGAWRVTAAEVWHAAVDLAATELGDDVLELDLRQALDGGALRLVLRAEGGAYAPGSAPAALAPGGELRVDPGYVTAAGAEHSAGTRCWITAVRRVRRGGEAVVEVEAVDGWGLLDAWRAPRALAWDGSLSALEVLTEVAQRVGLRLASAGGSAELGLLTPAFLLRPGERASAAVRRLLGALPDMLVMRGIEPVLVEPLAGAAAGYAYGGAGEHPLLEAAIEQAAPGVAWARAFGGDRFAEAIDGAALDAGGGVALAVDENLDAQDRVDARAAAMLRQAALRRSRGRLLVPVNAGQEPGDVIAVTDATLGIDGERFRVAEVRLRYRRRGEPRYDMALALVEV